jgi:hypothetical protein
MKEQLVKVFTEPNKELEIAKLIKDGWEVILITSCTAGIKHQQLCLTILFERSIK